MSLPLQILWFKRDLRIADHRALAAAAARGPVLPLYVAEPELWAQPTSSARQWSFIAETLAELREDLAGLGQPLVVRTGDAADVFEAVRRTHGVGGLWSHEETGDLWTFARDRKVADWARRAGVEWTELRQSGVIRRLGARDGWEKRWDAFMAEPIAEAPALAPLADIEPGAIPDAAALSLPPDPCPERQRGGRRAALDLQESFLTERGETYRKAMSSPVEGETACSRLSPHLAVGALSMREAAQALWRRQREAKLGQPGGWRGSLQSFNGRLHWRDHFMQKLEDEPEIERRCLHPAYEGARSGEDDAARRAAWEAGETGLPFVDACMRYLRATGWLNFRMRAMLVAVASYHLALDWRRTGEHLARLFTDYEPGIHWPQVQMQSGVTGVNAVRIYNPVKQGRDQDPTGAFIRRWVPELADVPDACLHEPWRFDGAGGGAYPAPVVDHLEAAKAARARVWAIRKGAAYRTEADAIQRKHGSRRRGVSGGRRKRAANKADEGQQVFDFGS